MNVAKFLMLLLKSLFKAEERRLNSIIVSLNARHKELYGINLDGFIYRGEKFIPKLETITIAGKGQPTKVLHHALNDDMEEFLRDLTNVKTHENSIKQVLFGLLVPCKSPQDMRDALPECLVGLIPELQAIPRTREPAYTIAHDERAVRQYEKALPKIEMYSISRLLY
jgi:hypothetical protein